MDGRTFTRALKLQRVHVPQRAPGRRQRAYPEQATFSVSLSAAGVCLGTCRIVGFRRRRHIFEATRI